ncbi:uncharacterized protein BDV14DRAFT_163541 [Aspergillus stella-maris]|uniref:uncharacterized protein n=1 Tax=Aspergillus stella-maris TaxID=1810926 RepID=UPI003CCD3A73
MRNRAGVSHAVHRVRDRLREKTWRCRASRMRVSLNSAMAAPQLNPIVVIPDPCGAESKLLNAIWPLIVCMALTYAPLLCRSDDTSRV